MKKKYNHYESKDQDPDSIWPFTKEYKIDGHSYPFCNVIEMEEQKTQIQTKFYHNILKHIKVWNTNKDQQYKFYFVDDKCKKICSIQKYIEMVKNDYYLCLDFKHKNLRIMKISSSIMTAYEQLIIGRGQDTPWYRAQSCAQKMLILKSIGNAIYKCNGLNQAAKKLYLDYGIKQFGEDSEGNHDSCDSKDNHDIILSNLLNNVSCIFFKQKEYKLSKDYATQALKWNPKYDKCIMRIQKIDDNNLI